LLAGLLFVCHPALTEAVDCISFNEDLLAALFFLLSLILYIKATDNQAKIVVYVLSLLSYFLGLLSKEMAITLPGVILLYDVAFRGNGKNSLALKEILHTIRLGGFYYSGYIAISLIYLVLRFSVFYQAKGSIEAHYGSLVDRIVFLPAHIFSFIKLAFAPFNLSAAHVFVYPHSYFEITNIVGFTVVCGLIVFSFYLYKWSKVIFFGIWWFVLTLFPVYNLIEIFHPFAERFVYIPIIGFCMSIPALIDALLTRIIRKPAAKLAARVVVVLILGVYAATTIPRNRDWKDGMTLWSKTVLTSPGSAIAHGNLGRAFQDLKKFDEAIQAYAKTIEINPSDFKAYHNLGVVYEHQGATDEAVQHYEKAIEIYPQYVDAHFNLANIYHKKGALDNAIAHYKKVIELQPEDFEARNNLGVAYAMQGKLDNAISEWEKVLEIDPENKSAEENIAKAKMEKP
jgi:tetratricopeptide (TPR) repeat protein